MGATTEIQELPIALTFDEIKLLVSTRDSKTGILPSAHIIDGYQLANLVELGLLINSELLNTAAIADTKRRIAHKIGATAIALAQADLLEAQTHLTEAQNLQNAHDNKEWPLVTTAFGDAVIERILANKLVI